MRIFLLLLLSCASCFAGSGVNLILGPGPKQALASTSGTGANETFTGTTIVTDLVTTTGGIGIGGVDGTASSIREDGSVSFSSGAFTIDTFGNMNALSYSNPDGFAVLGDGVTNYFRGGNLYGGAVLECYQAGVRGFYLFTNVNSVQVLNDLGPNVFDGLYLFNDGSYAFGTDPNDWSNNPFMLDAVGNLTITGAYHGDASKLDFSSVPTISDGIAGHLTQDPVTHVLTVNH